MLSGLISDNSKLIVIPLIIGAYLSGSFYLAESFSIPLTIFQLTLLFGLFIFFIKKIFTSDTTFEIYGLEIQYLIFFALIFFSIIYGPERDSAIFYAIRMGVLLFMTYLIVNSINTVDQLKIIMIAIICSALIVSIYSLYNNLLNPEIVLLNYVSQGNSLIRASGTDTDPNIFASNFIIPILALAVAFIKLEKKSYKIISIAIMIVLLLSVLTTYSRSVWISITIGLAIIVFRYKRFDLIFYAILMGLIGLIIIPDAMPFVSSIFERLKDIFAGSSDDSSNIRILLGTGALKMFLDSNLFGVGFQSFSTVFRNYYTIQETLGIYEPHNIFYTVLAELGIIGFFVFVYIIWRILATGYACSRHQENDFLSMTGMTFYTSFICYMIFYQFYGGFTNSFLYILIGLIFTVKKLSQQTISVNNIYA